MSRYIEMCKECIHYQMCHSIHIDAPCAAYKNKADVVEVVRCRDCKNWDKDHIEKHTYSREDDTLADFAECLQWSCWSTCKMTRYNDFCSCGERREGSDEKG